MTDDAILEDGWQASTPPGDTILRDFVDSSRLDLQALRDAITTRRHDDVRRHAHRLKGASGIVGADVLSDLAQQLEHRAASNSEDWNGLSILVARASEQVDVVAGGLGALAGSMKSGGGGNQTHGRL